jgi:predicted aconitase
MRFVNPVDIVPMSIGETVRQMQMTTRQLRIEWLEVVMKYETSYRTITPLLFHQVPTRRHGVSLALSNHVALANSIHGEKEFLFIA